MQARKIRVVATVAVAVGVVLWGEVLAQSGVPLQAVEANEIDEGFGDGPTPFPRPTPPMPGPVPDTAEATYAYAKLSTWWTWRGEALVFHDGCAERIDAAPFSASVPESRKAVVRELVADHSIAMTTALAPWREAFRATVPDRYPIDLVNGEWWTLIEAHAEEIAAVVNIDGLAPQATGSCDSGRCDCCTTAACCASGNCGCETYNATTQDCAAKRSTCSVDYGPIRDTTTTTLRWGY